MKFKNTTILILLFTFIFNISCKDSAAEKLEDRIEDKAEDLEDRSDNLGDAADYVEEGFDDIEDAIENFRDALEEVENPEDRKAIRKRIIEIMDNIDLKNDNDI